MSLSAINIGSCVWTLRWQSRFMSFCHPPPSKATWLTFSNHFFPVLNHFFPLFHMMKLLMKPLFGWLTFSNHFFPVLNHFFPLSVSGLNLWSGTVSGHQIPEVCPLINHGRWAKAKSFLCSLSKRCLGAIRRHGDWHDDHGNGMSFKWEVFGHIPKKR